MAASRRKRRSAPSPPAPTVLVAGTAVFKGGPAHYAANIAALARLTRGRRGAAAAAAAGDAARRCSRARDAPLRVWWRRTWFYRRLLKGPLADRIVFHPYDALPRRLEDADALLRGRFRFHGDTVDVHDGVRSSTSRRPVAAWAEALHGFAWLPPLSAAGGEPARALATNLIAQWIKRHGRYSEPAWSPHVMARRLVHIFAMAGW